MKESLRMGNELGFGRTGHGVCVRDVAGMAPLLGDEPGRLVLGLAQAQKQDGVGRCQMSDDCIVEALQAGIQHADPARRGFD